MSFARRVSPGQSDAGVEQPWPRIARDRNRAVPEKRDDLKQAATGREQSKTSGLMLRHQVSLCAARHEFSPSRLHSAAQARRVNRTRPQKRWDFCGFGFRNSDFIRASDFGFRRRVTFAIISNWLGFFRRSVLGGAHDRFRVWAPSLRVGVITAYRSSQARSVEAGTSSIRATAPIE